MKNKSVGFSLIAVMAVLPFCADAAIRVGNNSRNKYQQVNEAAVAVQNVQPTELPINVKNTDLANQILSGDTSSGIGIDTLEQCSMIYPTGIFEWSTPTIGRKAGMPSMCTAVVEMRALMAGPNGENLILARANLAAGDSIKCNISAFPEGSWLPDAGNVIFPADSEPTKEDVIAVMNQEQKQNAAIKIIGGTILGGLIGNFTGANDPGNDSMLGTDKGKLKNTAIGAAGGAAVMLGNAYGGKVAGDMILSAGVNAAAGGVIGNVMASGDSVLRIENCTVDNKETTCLWGYYKETRDLNTDKEQAFVNIADISDFYVCKIDDNTCRRERLTGGMPKKYKEKTRQSDKKQMLLSDAFEEQFREVDSDQKYCFKDGKMEQTTSCDDAKNIYIIIDGASIVTKTQPAMIVGIQDKKFGYKKSEWSDIQKQQNISTEDIVGRNGKGEAISLGIKPEDLKLEDFDPMTLDADDGGIIDLDNNARLKGTLTGAGVGGAMGAYTAYQGAQDDVTQRWMAEVQAYKDSLNKIVCVTGTRFLSSYNDDAVIPVATQTQQ